MSEPDLREPKLRAFQITETEWWAAEDSESARSAFAKTVGQDEAVEMFEEFGDPIELTDESLDKLEITEVDEPGQPKHTFRQAIEEIRASGRWPAFIASTDY